MSHIERRLRDKQEGRRHVHLQGVEREQNYYDAPAQIHIHAPQRSTYAA